MGKLVRRGVLVGAIVGMGYAAWRFLAARAPDTAGVTFTPQPFPMPPKPVPPVTISSPSAPRTQVAPSTTPDDDGGCPLTHPIKGKLSTGIYHRPGAFAYERTRADRCYRDEPSAQSDGLRAAKR